MIFLTSIKLFKKLKNTINNNPPKNQNGYDDEIKKIFEEENNIKKGPDMEDFLKEYESLEENKIGRVLESKNTSQLKFL